MTDYTELRRLAEQATPIANSHSLLDSHDEEVWADFRKAANPAAILSLLDERDARESAANYYRDLAAERAHLQGLAEQRVAALEEGLRRWLAQDSPDGYLGDAAYGELVADTRQLLQASAQDASEGSGK